MTLVTDDTSSSALGLELPPSHSPRTIGGGKRPLSVLTTVPTETSSMNVTASEERLRVEMRDQIQDPRIELHRGFEGVGDALDAHVGEVTEHLTDHETRISNLEQAASAWPLVLSPSAAAAQRPSAFRVAIGANS